MNDARAIVLLDGINRALAVYGLPKAARTVLEQAVARARELEPLHRRDDHGQDPAQ